jgi:hypothetical protein
MRESWSHGPTTCKLRKSITPLGGFVLRAARQFGSRLRPLGGRADMEIARNLGLF